MEYYAVVNLRNTKDLRKHHTEWKKLDTKECIPYANSIFKHAKLWK